MLRESRNGLELRVTERTAELVRANRELQNTKRNSALSSIVFPALSALSAPQVSSKSSIANSSNILANPSTN